MSVMNGSAQSACHVGYGTSYWAHSFVFRFMGPLFILIRELIKDSYIFFSLFRYFK